MAGPSGGSSQRNGAMLTPSSLREPDRGPGGWVAAGGERDPGAAGMPLWAVLPGTLSREAHAAASGAGGSGGTSQQEAVIR